MSTYRRSIKVIGISDNQATSSLSVQEMLDMVVPGRAFLARAKNDPVTARIVTKLEPLHSMIQRDLTGQKLANAKGALREYIEEEWLDGGSGALGVLPPFILLFPDKELEGLEEGQLQIPPGSKAILLDGESRVESMLEIIADPEVSEEVVSSLLGKRVSALILFGLDVETAAKYFADINGRGVQVNPNLITARDLADPYWEVAQRVFEAIDVELECEKRQVAKNSPAVLTALQARTMVGAMVLGVAAIGYGAKRMPKSVSGKDVNFARLETAAKNWLPQVFTTFKPEAFKDRERVLRSVPVLVSIGAIGKGMYTGEPGDQAIAHTFLADREIDWTVGDHWSGVCGKMSPSTGRFSVGSGKEYAYATYRALTDENDNGWSQIRHSK